MQGKICKHNTEVYSRVVGFYRPTSLWNKGKREEFKARKTYLVLKTLERNQVKSA